jgi:hypothetical protein
MRVLKDILFTMVLVTGLTLAVSAQKGGQQKPPPKDPPPKVNPGQKPPPPKNEKPKKPGMAMEMGMTKQGYMA